MKYFLVAGEASGDLHGSNLIRSIRKKDPEAEFRFWGGDLMNEAADGLLQHYRDVTLMGFVEVLLNLNRIRKNLSRCKSQISAFNPDVVILIDYPGFNLRIAAFAKSRQIRTVYYIAPKVWAWKENRARKLEAFIDDLLLILPFEQTYFKKWKVNATYVGNPLMDVIHAFSPETAFRQTHGLSEKPVIALLPGSRKQEIRRMLPPMLEAVKNAGDYQVIVAGAPGIEQAFYHEFLQNNQPIVYNQTYDLLHISSAAIVCSGTATLETALFGVPQVCCYAGNPVSYFIAKRLVKISYISLVNLCMNSPVIRELIQDEMSVGNMEKELNRLLHDSAYRSTMNHQYEVLKQLIGEPGASDRAAAIICRK